MEPSAPSSWAPASAGADTGDKLERIAQAPFGRILRRPAEPGAPPVPAVLMVSPLSGLNPEGLHDMIAVLAPRRRLDIVAWVDAGDVPAARGPFGIADNVAYVRDAIALVGAGAHVVGLCQSAWPALVATALLAQEPGAPAPATLTLIGGKLDTRLNPTRADHFAQAHARGWFEAHAIERVPSWRAGYGRAVYPAATQASVFAAYLGRQLMSGGELLYKSLLDDGVDPMRHPLVPALLTPQDLPAEFFLDTIEIVFHEARLTQGRLDWRDRRVDPCAVRRTALMTIEGGRDDIAGAGQTEVAHRLCASLPPSLRAHHVEPEIGHFGLFHGRVLRERIAPRIESFMARFDGAGSAAAA